MSPRMQQRLEWEYRHYEEMEEEWQGVLEEQKKQVYGKYRDESDFEEEPLMPDEAQIRSQIFVDFALKLGNKKTLEVKDVDEYARTINNYDKGVDLQKLRKEWNPKVALEQRKIDRVRLVMPELNKACKGLIKRIEAIEK